MASQKERARWERWFDEVTARMGQQRRSIERLVLVNTEALAALHEIAHMEPVAEDEQHAAVRRAAEAIERIEEPSAAITSEARELTSTGDPDDPRNRLREIQ